MRRTNVGLALQNISKNKPRKREDTLRDNFSRRTSMSGFSRSILGDEAPASSPPAFFSEGSSASRVGSSEVRSGLTTDDGKVSKIVVKLDDIRSDTKESLQLLKKSSFAEGETSEPQSAVKIKTIEELKKNVQLILKTLEKKGSIRTERKSDIQRKSKPLSSETLERKEGESKREFVKRRKEVQRAEEIQKFGGTGIAQKFMYGFRTGRGESKTAATSLGRAFAKPEDLEWAEKTLNPSIAEDKKERAKQLDTKLMMAEKEEAEQEHREELQERLKKIEKAIEQIDSQRGDINIRILLPPGAGQRPGPPGPPAPGGPGEPKKPKPKPKAPRPAGKLAALALALLLARARIRTPPAGGARVPPAVGALTRGAGALGRGALTAARFAGPAGLAATVAMGAYGAISGAMNAGELLGLEEEDDISLRQRLAGAAGGAAGELTFGIADKEAIARKLAGGEPLTTEETQALEQIDMESRKRRRGAGRRRGIIQRPEPVLEESLRRETAVHTELQGEANTLQAVVALQPIVNNITTVVPGPAGDSGGGIISARNGEPSISSYVASIFDHPITHPGMFKM